MKWKQTWYVIQLSMHNACKGPMKNEMKFECYSYVIMQRSLFTRAWFCLKFEQYHQAGLMINFKKIGVLSHCGWAQGKRTSIECRQVVWVQA